MKTLLMSLAFCGYCFAQTAMISDIRTAGGFLDVCGRNLSQLSKEQMDAMAKAPAGEFMHTIDKALGNNVADQMLCLGYLSGLIDGWKEGHNHGVLAAHFSAGVPRDLPTAMKSLSDKELEAQITAMKNDVPCLPEHLTIGEQVDAVLKYIRDQAGQNPFLRMWLTSRTVPLALRDAFPCPAAKPAIPDAQ